MNHIYHNEHNFDTQKKRRICTHKTLDDVKRQLPASPQIAAQRSLLKYNLKKYKKYIQIRKVKAI